MSFRQDCVTPVLHHRQLTLWSLQKNITYALCQSHKHYWRFLKYYFNRPNRRQLWNGILWLYSKHHPVFFSRRKNRQLVLHHLIDLIWGDTDKRTFFFFFDKRTFYKNFMVNKVSEETESSCVFNVGSTFLRMSKRKFLSLLILTFSIWQMLIFFPFCLCF